MVATHTQLNRQLFLREFTCHQLLLSGMFRGDVYQWKFPPRNTCVSLQSPHCEIYDYSTVHTVSILAGPYPHGTVSTPLLNTFALISARVLETLRSRNTSEVGLGSLCGYSAKEERSMEIIPITVLLTMALLWPGTPAMTTGYSLHIPCVHIIPWIMADVVSGRCTFESFTSCCSTSRLWELWNGSLLQGMAE